MDIPTTELFIAGLVLLLVLFMIRDNADKEQQQEAKKRQMAKRKQDALDAECKILSALHERTTETFLSLKDLVPATNENLNRAEQEFEEGAFAPFWDEIENATNGLAAYHQGVNEVEHNANEYSRRSSVLSVNIPSFEIPQGELPDARPVATRLSQVVRRAQKDFQFASIYEQRKTNQLLYAGFGTLASAIDRMQSSIFEALDGLSTSIGITLNDLVAVSTAQADMLGTLVEHEQSRAKVQKKFEKDSLEESKRQSQMLDNIQRHKKTIP